MRSSKKQIKRTLSLALAVLLMLTTPLAALAAEEIPEEEKKIETIVDSEDSLEEIEGVEEQKIIVEEENEIPEEIEEEIKQEEEINPVVEELDETKKGQQELLGASGDIIYWGITDGVLQISVSEVGGEHSGSFSYSDNSRPWYDYRRELTKIYVGDENGTVRPIYMGFWFADLTKVSEIHFDNIDTSNVTNMDHLFDFCDYMESIDISSFDTGNVITASSMFKSCGRLKTIYVGNGFSTENLVFGNDMFIFCYELFGGNGTAYDADHVDSTYARVDDPDNGNPGYFTFRASDEDPDIPIPPFHPVRPTNPTSTSSSVTSSINKWEYHSEGDYWTYTKNGILKNTWAYLDNPYASANQHKSDWFYFDGTGKMLTGWQKIDNKWYYLHPFKDGTGTLGACLIGPAITPDGYYVDETGAWVKIDVKATESAGNVREENTVQSGYVGRADLRNFPEQGTFVVNIDNIPNEITTKYSDEELNEMIVRADVNRDGKVSFEEFYAIMTKKI